MNSTLIIAVAAIAVQLVGEPTSAAYQLEPISRVFAPSGSRATQSFDVVNNGAERIALTVSFATLERDDNYVESNRNAEDEFLAYPSQIILAPGKTQTIRVSWLGAPDPARELTYRIIVTQVPIELLDHTAKTVANGRVRVMLNYRGTIFIRPAKAAPKLETPTAERTTGTSGDALVITLTNVGTAVGLVKLCKLELAPRTGGTAIELPASAVATLKNTRVLAASRRRYVLPWPPGLVSGPVTVTGTCAVSP